MVSGRSADHSRHRLKSRQHQFSVNDYAGRYLSVPPGIQTTLDLRACQYLYCDLSMILITVPVQLRLFGLFGQEAVFSHLVNGYGSIHFNNIHHSPSIITLTASAF
jgi:hypothetical protein